MQVNHVNGLVMIAGASVIALSFMLGSGLAWWAGIAIATAGFAFKF